MKKIVFLIILFFPFIVLASTKDTVTLSKCVDGDTARFILNKEEIKVRFIGIDTPESVKPNTEVEPYGKEASNYTCKKLKNAKKIVLEYEEKKDKIDRYGRYLAYVFVDDKLLEELIVKNGYANLKYINSNYKYYDELIKAEEIAKKNKKNIYSDDEYVNNELKDDIEKIVKKYTKKILSNILKEIFN